MVSLLYGHKSYGRVVNGPVGIDPSPHAGAGLSAYYLFNQAGTTSLKNSASWRNNMTLQSGARIATTASGPAYVGVNSATSFATTGTGAFTLGIVGNARRTIFCRFRAGQSSGPTNVGGLWCYGDTTGTNSFLAIQQVSDAAPNNSNDSWAVSYGAGKLYFTVPNTAGNVHSIVLTYDGSSLQVFVDGQQLALAVANLATSSTPNFDVGRWFNPTGNIATNYFSGAIYQLGIATYDWNLRQIRQWHANPYSLLRSRRFMMASPGPSFPLNINLTGIPSAAAVGTLTFAVQGLSIVLAGIPPTAAVGNMTLFEQGGTQVIALEGTAPTARFGNNRLRRQGGIWQPTPASTGDWTVTPPPPGG